MNDNEIFWYLAGGGMLFLALLKETLFKKILDSSFGSNVNSNKGETSKRNRWSLFVFLGLGLVLFLIPSMFNIKKDLKNEHSIMNSSKENSEPVHSESKKKGNEVEVVEKIITGANELILEPRARRDSIYSATKDKKWVYQIGDLMDNEEVVLEKYKQLANKESICLFKNRGNFLFFQNTPDSLITLRETLPKAQKVFGSLFPVKIIDLMNFCNRANHRIVNTGLRRIGSRKDELILECFEVK
jgi:hypothetical protein